jgi:hypothetical protein
MRAAQRISPAGGAPLQFQHTQTPGVFYGFRIESTTCGNHRQFVKQYRGEAHDNTDR